MGHALKVRLNDRRGLTCVRLDSGTEVRGETRKIVTRLQR